MSSLCPDSQRRILREQLRAQRNSSTTGLPDELAGCAVLTTGPEQPLEGSFTEEQAAAAIYFGSAAVSLAAAPGRTFSHCDNDWRLGEAAESVRRAAPLAHLGAELADVAVPGIPAIDYVADAPSQDTSSWPPALRQPLIKVDSSVQEATQLRAVASGVRSALVEIDDKWYRLKGCGNYDEGFPIRQAKQSLHRDGVTIKPPWRDMRGCAFWHTASRENVMTSKIAACLGPLGITACNRPLGICEYAAPQPLGPLLPPCCIVMETRGDRRLGTHVLAGLAMLLPQLVDLDAVDLPQLLGHFPDHRRVGATGLLSADTLMTDYFMAKCFVEPAAAGWGVEYPDLARDESCFTSLIGFPLPERAPAADMPPPQVVGGRGRAEGSKEMSAEWKALWRQECAELQAVQQGAERETSVIAYLYSRVGYECGRFMRALHDMKISWGSGRDHYCDPNERHCNAHFNNMTIAPESTGGTNLLDYLDLDMAHEEHAFIEDWPLHDSSLTHEGLLFIEKVRFMQSLVGGLCVCCGGGGVPKIAQKLGMMPVEGSVAQAVLDGLNDTLLMSYMHAYERDSKYPCVEYDPQLHHAAHKLIRLSIMMMADYLA